MAGPHHRGDYRTRAKRVTDAAKADQGTLCWRCAKPLAEHAPHRNGKRPWWTAGHVRDGDPLSPLLPEASTCNMQAGGQVGNERKYPPTVTTRRW